MKALSSALAAIGLTAVTAPAQQPPQGPSPLSRAPSSLSRARTLDVVPSTDSVDPMLASKATRYLLRNGMDYLAYREYARALSFFRAVEARDKELTDSDRETLKKGIARAQQGLREAVNSPRVVTQNKARLPVQPGGFALANPTTPEPVQLTSVEVVTPAPAPAPAPAAPTRAVVVALASSPAPQDAPQDIELPPMPTRALAPAPIPLADAGTQPASTAPSLPEASTAPSLPEPSSGPAPILPAQDGPQLPPTGLPATAPPPIGLELPEASQPSPLPEPVASPIELPVLAPAPVELPASSPAPAPTPPTDTVQAVSAVPEVAQRSDSPPSPMPSEPAPVATNPVPEPPPAREAPSLPRLPDSASPAIPLNADRSEEILPPRLRREVEAIAQGTPRDGRPAGPLGADPADPNAPTAPPQGSTRLSIERAPSPTEARPIRRIPVPEEFVPLAAREWNPNRKYWAAAGTCHMTLYFQDPVLERYGQGVEQSLGPIGRYFSYPLDDPRQSNQRNQILQPFYSIGKFAFQVGTLPYKVLMDPPGEAEYDLGYYRPGDRIPADTIYMTPTGVGPPLKGRRY